MPPHRWQQVQSVLADAIAAAAGDRPALLDARCAGDADLRREVESLLAAHEHPGIVDELAPLVGNAATPGSAPMPEWSGRRVAHYVVQEPLGAGGMGVVYTAHDERLGRHVALKFLPPHLSADPEAKSRFIAEARAAAALDHPNVCTIFEIGETEDGQLFLAMPLYEGETLRERLDRGRLPFDDALPIVLQVARGLGHAHDAGIVHRDVKPSNIVVLPDGTAKILDFGIAQIHDRSLADPQALVGTISYMSPEQASAGPTDIRSDIWSLGVVIHEMLAGARPFHGEDAPAVLRAILTLDPDVSATSYPDVPGGVERILRKALVKAPDQRYSSMALLAADLSALVGGHADAPAAVSTTERRRAAVLVSLVSEYASLVDQMTPAEAHRLVALVRDTAVDVVRSYGGLVNQAIGDEVISVFGVPVSNEDDDLRAVRAALELHARVKALQPAAAPSGIRLSLQSGLHVGPVVARRLNEGPRRYDIVGAPATTAARLAALAERDAVWITAEAQRLVAPYMQTTPCAPVVLDSQAGPVTPFRVQGETGIATRLDASSQTGLTPYVGRQTELSLLQSVIMRAGSGAGGVVAVVGEPGVGKSRLLYELQRHLEAEPDARVLCARCMAYGDRISYGVFVQIVCAVLNLELPLRRGDDVVTAIRALDPSLEQFLPLLLHLLSVSSSGHTLPRHLHGEHLQAALLDALAAILGVLVARGPLCVLVEDWHWADSGSRAAFMRVAELTDSSPLVLIVTSRLDLDNQGGWPPGTRRVQLEQLDLPASAAIMRAVLRVGQVSDDLARRLYDRAGGNPFFLEQMCGALLERRAVTVSDGEAVAGDGEAALSLLPDTVQGVIRARLDNLDPQALDVARIASVIGWEFDHALLAGVVPADVDLARALTALEAAGVIQQTSVSPTLSYRFTHALKQEVCYESLVGHQRKKLHGAIGRALASGGAGRIDEAAALLAHHFARAEEWPSAIRFGRRAAERAIALSQFADALSTVDHVLDWVGRLPGGEGDDLATDLLFQQERLCETLGLRARQQQIIDLLIARLARDGSSARLAEVYLRQGDLSTLLKRFDAADRALSTALRIGQERGDNTLLRSGLRSLGLLRWHEGRHAEALEITRRALALDRECDDAVAVALDLTNLGSILRALGDHPGARVQLEAALAMPALRRDPKKWVYAQHNLANVYRSMDDLDRALECLVQCDEVARTHLLPIQRSFHLTSIAHIHLQQGRIDAALETYHAAVDLSRRARHAEGLVQSLRMIGNALLGLARYEEALPYLREAAQLFAQLDDPAAEAEMWTGVARILERRSPEGAADAWNVVLSLHRRRGDARGELDAREGVARALRSSGHGQAIAAFESTLALALTIGDHAREAAIRNVLGILEWERAQYGSALNHYEAALAVVRGQGRLGDEAVVLNSLGACLTKLGRHDEARTVLEESLAISRQIGLRPIEAHALAALGRMSLSAREPGRAIEYFGRAASVAAIAGDETFSAACAEAARAASHS
ncbi:MAG TPA: tetratricopeptide repeat protein [Vicinamibacterales bacterium]|nr:tetratricopeptide repeat protein [Vicinamibacterales bacterium]